MTPDNWPDIYVGSVDTPSVEMAPFDGDPDDEDEGATSDDVVLLLGFDPEEPE